VIDWPVAVLSDHVQLDPEFGAGFADRRHVIVVGRVVAEDQRAGRTFGKRGPPRKTLQIDGVETHQHALFGDALLTHEVIEAGIVDREIAEEPAFGGSASGLSQAWQANTAGTSGNCRSAATVSMGALP
jgi:hypothetical protein